jgi:hypothetical protein
VPIEVGQRGTCSHGLSRRLASNLQTRAEVTRRFLPRRASVEQMAAIGQLSSDQISRRVGLPTVTRSTIYATESMITDADAAFR